MERPSIPIWIFVVFFPMLHVAAEVEGLPQKALAALGDGDFRSRENGQSELLAWARLRPEPSMEELLRYCRSSNDPEVRARCMAVLRELVMDQYMSEGPGFLGIVFDYLKIDVPGDSKLAHSIEVKSVSLGSPADLAGLQIGDSIISLNGKGWSDDSAQTDFKERIASMRPGTNVKMMIFRDGELISKDILLTRRPLSADRFMLGGLNAFDPESVEERAAKEDYFKDWLSARKTR